MAKKRVQLELSEKAWAELNKLREDLGKETISDTVKGSLKLAKIFAETSPDEDIIVRNRKTNEEKKLVFVY